ncbi:MAG: oligosaccharide flippase family protein [Actinomycetota bacterium]|nr:oligosaccharide flippase family protein [Actinomycetota bacterium]
MSSDDDSRAGPGGLAATASATMAVQVATYLLIFLVSILVARGLGPVGRGLYYLPITAAATVLVLVHLGLEGSNTFFVSERRFTLRQVAAASTFLAPISGVIGAFGLTALYALTDDSLLKGVSWEAFLIPTALLPLQLHMLWAINVFTLGGRVVRAQLAQCAGALLQFLMLLPVVLTGDLTLLYALASYGVFIAVPWLMLVVWSRPFAPLRPALDRELLRKLVGFGLKLQLGQVFIFLLFRADVLLVNLMLGPRDVGIYSLTVIFAEAVMLLTLPLMLAALPLQASMSIQDAGALSFKAARFNGVFATALSALAAATMWLAIPLLYGDDFAAAYVALVALLPGVVAVSMARPLGNWLVRQERPWVLTGFGAAAFTTNVALNVLLLPVVGIVGASLASSAAYIGLTGAMVAWGLRSAGLGAREALVPTREDIASLRRGTAAVGARLLRRESVI